MSFSGPTLHGYAPLSVGDESPLHSLTQGWDYPVLNECKRLVSTVTIVSSRYWAKGALISTSVAQTCKGAKVAAAIFPALKSSVQSASRRGTPK